MDHWPFEQPIEYKIPVYRKRVGCRELVATQVRPDYFILTVDGKLKTSAKTYERIMLDFDDWQDVYYDQGMDYKEDMEGEPDDDAPCL
jgi:hypothetical protein